MTGTDDAATRPLHMRPQPLDGPLPDVFTTFEDEFFVDWQVAEMVASTPEKQVLYR